MHFVIYELLCKIGEDLELLKDISKKIEEHIGEDKLKEIFKSNENKITHEEAENYLSKEYGSHKWTYDQIKSYLEDKFDYEFYKTTPEEMYLLMNKFFHEHKEVHGEISPEKAKIAAVVFLKHHNIEDLIFMD